MIVNVSEIITLINETDERMRNNIPEATKRYHIQQAIITLATDTLCFIKKKSIPLDSYFDDDTIDDTYIDPEDEIIDYYDIYFQNRRNGDIYRRKVRVENDKSIHLVRFEARNRIKLYSLVLKYYYVPILTKEDKINIEPAVYMILLDYVFSKMWNYLKDFDKQKFFDREAKEKIRNLTIRFDPTDRYMPNKMRGFDK